MAKRSLLHAIVHPAHIQDRDGAKLVSDSFPDAHLDRLEVLWADACYDGDLANWMQNTFTDWRLQLVTRLPDAKGFRLPPWRWVVERTFAWLGRFRRLSRDYERSLLHSTPSLPGLHSAATPPSRSPDPFSLVYSQKDSI